MSYIDIYNEQIYDLLEDLGRHQKPMAKRIRDHRTKGKIQTRLKKDLWFFRRNLHWIKLLN